MIAFLFILVYLAPIFFFIGFTLYHCDKAYKSVYINIIDLTEPIPKQFKFQIDSANY